MKTNIEKLRKLVIAGRRNNEKNGIRTVRGLVLEQELAFIERCYMEDYFLMAHKLVEGLRKETGILIGPGWGWMISSHVCCTLGLTGIGPNEIAINPEYVWGDEDFTSTITIEVNDDAYELACKKAVKLLGKEEASRFKIIPSPILTRIKRIQEMIAKKGKEVPQLYDTSLWNEDYKLFYKGDLDGIPMFEDEQIQQFTKTLLPKSKYGSFNELLDIISLFLTGAFHKFHDTTTIAMYQEKNGLIFVLGKNLMPWGIIYAEDAGWFIHGWIGLSWKQTAQIIKLANEKKEHEAEKLKHIFLQQGIGSGFRESELKRIWDAIFKRESDKPLLSKAHYAGRLYISVFLARLKHQFPKEFYSIKTK